MLGPTQRAHLARWAMFISLPLWPISMLTWARHEQPTVLALSWLALIISLADVAATTDVRKHNENQSHDE